MLKLQKRIRTGNFIPKAAFTDYGITFNDSFMKEIGNKMNCEIYIDEQNKRIGLKFLSNPTTDSYKLCIYSKRHRINWKLSNYDLDYKNPSPFEYVGGKYVFKFE